MVHNVNSEAQETGPGTRGPSQGSSRAGFGSCCPGRVTELPGRVRELPGVGLVRELPGPVREFLDQGAP